MSTNTAKENILLEITTLMKQCGISLEDIQRYQDANKLKQQITNIARRIVRNAEWYQQDLKKEGGCLPKILMLENEDFILNVVNGEESAVILKEKDGGFQAIWRKSTTTGVDQISEKSASFILNSGLLEKLDKLVYKEAMYTIAEIKSSEMEYNNEY